MNTETTKNTEYLFTLTSFHEDGDRVAAPLVLANSALANGSNVILWLSLEGVELAKKGATQNITTRSFPPVGELLDSYIDNGGRIGICPPCGKTHGVTEQNMVQNSEWMGAAAVMAAAEQRQTMAF